MGWGTTYVAKRVGKYWTIYFNGWRKDKWLTNETSLKAVRAWFKERDKPYFIPDEVMLVKDNPNITKKDLESAMRSYALPEIVEFPHNTNFYDKYLLGEWDAKDYNTCSLCGAPVPPGFSGKCGQPCL
jgi:hypothetical protein